jgi:hypothetical protein
MKKICTLFAASLFTLSAFAQIPNAGFETWTTAGTGSYDNPTGWGNANPTIDGFASTAYTCIKGTTGAPAGSAFIKLEAKAVLTIVAPGIAVSGNVTVVPSPFSVAVDGGFPYTSRPASLTGKWEHMGQGADHGRVAVFLTKWNISLNKRDTVAKIDSTLTGMVMTWASFTMPLKYMSGLTPDTGLVVLSTSADPAAAVVGSFLNADDLAFTGTVPSGVISVATPGSSSSVFPNPASGTATVYYHSIGRKQITINLTDVTGKIVKTTEQKAISGENNFTLDLKGVAQGIYLVQIVDDAGVAVKKLMVE